MRVIPGTVRVLRSARHWSMESPLVWPMLWSVCLRFVRVWFLRVRVAYICTKVWLAGGRRMAQPTLSRCRSYTRQHTSTTHDATLLSGPFNRPITFHSTGATPCCLGPRQAASNGVSCLWFGASGHLTAGAGPSPLLPSHLIDRTPSSSVLLAERTLGCRLRCLRYSDSWRRRWRQ